MGAIQSKSRAAAMLFSAAALVAAIPAQAEWGGGYGGTPGASSGGNTGSPGGGSNPNCVPGATNCKSGNSSGNKGSGGWNQQQGDYGGGRPCQGATAAIALAALTGEP